MPNTRIRTINTIPHFCAAYTLQRSWIPPHTITNASCPPISRLSALHWLCTTHALSRPSTLSSPEPHSWTPPRRALLHNRHDSSTPLHLPTQRHRDVSFPAAALGNAIARAPSTLHPTSVRPARQRPTSPSRPYLPPRQHHPRSASPRQTPTQALSISPNPNSRRLVFLSAPGFAPDANAPRTRAHTTRSSGPPRAPQAQPPSTRTVVHAPS
ncbi:hypothetical protein B0H16DRAFT_1656441 [Mycena metata]|uniref:Uncharacterized protein n=1 Tax=Mycena metata TaxID=1033252 RepID=A0AAD7DDW0_9AGAR|nr:hypothetical protein B0H16DRAFT_1656441 [Mycena metata]